MDVSSSGPCATAGGRSAPGRQWRWHTNFLEMMPVFLAPKAFLPDLKGGKMRSLDFCLILLLNAGRVAGQMTDSSGGVCYILDAILIAYGVVLTVLYCRLKMSSSHSFSEKRDGDIYQRV
ncbi:unnamed protein product [Leuciscus chuanchicus]